MFKLALVSFCIMASSMANASGRRSDQRTGGSRRTICTGMEPARRGAEYSKKPSFDEKILAYQAAASQYEIDHPEGAEFAGISAQITGTSCFSDSDCATSDESKYRGLCLRYEWTGTNGSCSVAPVIVIPAPPAAPVMNCGDVTCPSNFQCEVENSTGAVGCVEQRLCTQPR
ncbi:MAG: hypothetical protein NT027_12335 [Proteobacteria bacterium]|nr:hypothetical protein [Pseudomonadota bacterium]